MKKADLIFCVLISIVSFNTIIYKLDIRNLFWDEIYTTYVAGKAPLEIIIHLYSVETNPPLFYLIAHPIISVYNSDFIARLIPATFGVLSLIAIYFLNLKHNNRTSAIAASILFFLSWKFIPFSRYFKMYTLFILLSTLSYHFFLNILFKKKSRNNNKYFIIFNVLGLYTHSWFPLVVATEFLTFVIFFLFKKIKLKKTLASFLIIGLLFLPWLPSFLSALDGKYYVESFGPVNSFDVFQQLSDINLFFYLFFVPVGIFILQKQHKKFAIYFLFFSPLIILTLTNYNFPVGDFRYYSFLFPLYYTLIGIAIGSIPLYFTLIFKGVSNIKKIRLFKILKRLTVPTKAINIITNIIFILLFIFILNYIVIPRTVYHIRNILNPDLQVSQMVSTLEEIVNDSDIINTHNPSVKITVEWYASEKLRNMINNPSKNNNNGTFWYITGITAFTPELMKHFLNLNQNVSQITGHGSVGIGQKIAQPINLTKPDIYFLELTFTKSHNNPRNNMTLEFQKDLNNKPSGESIYSKSFKPIENMANKIYLNWTLNTSETYWMVLSANTTNSAYNVASHCKDKGNALLWFNGWHEWKCDLSYELYSYKKDYNLTSSSGAFSNFFGFNPLWIYKMDFFNKKIEIPITEGNWTFKPKLINYPLFSYYAKNINLYGITGGYSDDGFLTPNIEEEIGELKFKISTINNSKIRNVIVNFSVNKPASGKHYVKIIVYNNNTKLVEYKYNAELISKEDNLTVITDKIGDVEIFKISNLNIEELIFSIQLYAESEKPIFLGAGELVELKQINIGFNVTKNLEV